MPKGSTGAPTNWIVNAKRVDLINCNCKNCFHSKQGAGTTYCSYYDLFSPNRKRCSRFCYINKKYYQRKKVHRKK
jgi:hypothetical protein